MQGIEEKVSILQKRKKGRPFKEPDKIEIERQEKLKAQKETNPPTRLLLDLRQEDHKVPFLP